MRPRPIHAVALLAAALLVLIGIAVRSRPGPAGARASREASPRVAPGGGSRPPAGGGEAVIPSTGQAVDTSKMVDVVRAEVDGGEATSKTGPTPLDFLWQEADPGLIDDRPYELTLPVGFQSESLAAIIPGYNPMTAGKVELGKQLYYDPRLSLDSTVSCASCHDPARGWTDNRVASVGIAGHIGARNAPTVLNTIFGRSMFWDGRAPSLEGQAQGPIQNKIEMGDQSYRRIVERFRAIPGYRDQFRKVFGTEVTLDGMAKAIASFERTALSGDSPFDRYQAGDPDDPATFANLTLAAKRGMVLFGMTLPDADPDAKQFDATRLRGRASCTTCHAGNNFTDESFHNLGVGYDPATLRFADLGRWVIAPIGTKTAAERGAFKTPTLRDAARTGPYMHDGSKPTLEAVIDFYDQGGQRNPALDPKIAPLNLSAGEKADLVAFLRSLAGAVVPVTIPTLPAGPDGRRPDPRAALNAPGGTNPPAPATAGRLGPAHRIAGLR